MEEKLVIKNLTKTFKLSSKQQKLEKTRDKIKVAVNDLSFTAYNGEIYGLLGPNGAGKTTTLRIISTLIKADSGDCLVDGISVKQNPDKVRGKIGFLTGELKLEDFFTPNYLFDFFSHLHDVPEDIIKERKEKLFNEFKEKERSISEGLKEIEELKTRLETGEYTYRIHRYEIIGGNDEKSIREYINYWKEQMTYLDFLKGRDTEKTNELLKDIDKLSFSEMRNKYFEVEVVENE